MFLPNRTINTTVQQVHRYLTSFREEIPSPPGNQIQVWYEAPNQHFNVWFITLFARELSTGVSALSVCLCVGLLDLTRGPKSPLQTSVPAFSSGTKMA